MAPDIGSDAAAPRGAPDDARCPRCGGAFHCGIHDATPCACTTLQLGAATLTGLRARYHGCLCLRCLHELSHDESAPTQAAIDGEMSTPRDSRAP